MAVGAILPIGVHRRPDLPKYNLPASLAGRHGWVRGYASQPAPSVCSDGYERRRVGGRHWIAARPRLKLLVPELAGGKPEDGLYGVSLIRP
jgi:hypothetical protein